ncbi:kinase-like protein [Laetiporus sulphureus 93-53]|uniref:non-specific serine/threonine protein kinase n=1 Tax=Laetiporus sulphureus 93-53 TaxID=1314785 RepID=A0A165D745_9APHY|nr:kinase-like protein [Laetiporus sulphureus 93-53]KZT04268.1 kinase-like protein [Laetiporus sulphureus 93-53]
MSSPLDLYEPLDVIGTGSFGIIRKVRRKSDGVIFARKELNFERMSERDRKQIVSEVNILKDLHHEHIVRYHDRHVDRDAGILYILMEYCGGGDLSSIIKQAQRYNRPVPEDTIWNYFMQILLALNHCHHPNNPTRAGGSGEADGKEKRPQILHRDLKPDNVFLDENNTVKLGDFGLSKALAQASFANTYVGTPYYMSPELMQEKAYDSKSDIWSLGCLIYELCALKPPFHEAKTHAELSILIRNGRIPPLPKGYSNALASVIKSMLNLNPAMRPSAAQLLGHERLELAFKVAETQKLLNQVKAHKANLINRERDLVAREAAAAERERALTATVAAKDEQIVSLRGLAVSAENMLQVRVREAVAKRDEELRVLVLKQEQEVAARMARREEEIMEAVRRREEDIARMWSDWETKTREAMTRAIEERMEWVRSQAGELDQERERLDEVRAELEEKMASLEAAEKKGTASDTSYTAGRFNHADAEPTVGASMNAKVKTPLEEVKNILAPLARLADSPDRTPVRPSQFCKPLVFETPRPGTLDSLYSFSSDADPPSAMKGVILTATGEPVATPRPSELAKLFVDTPRVGLNFTKIFDCEEGESVSEDGYETDTLPPAKRRTSLGTGASLHSEEMQTPQPQTTVKANRMRRPSLQRASSGRLSLDNPIKAPIFDQGPRRTSLDRTARRTSLDRTPTVASRSKGLRPSASASSVSSVASTISTASSTVSSATSTATAPASIPTRPAACYDLSDEENLPSPFLKRRERQAYARTISAPIPSRLPPATSQPNATRNAVARKNGATLRTMAVVNAANAVNTPRATRTVPAAGRMANRTTSTGSLPVRGTVRPSIAKAHQASEQAKRVLLRS